MVVLRLRTYSHLLEQSCHQSNKVLQVLWEKCFGCIAGHKMEEGQVSLLEMECLRELCLCIKLKCKWYE